MAAYATLVSAMNIIDNLQLHPHPPISLHIKQVESLTQKINFLLEFLEAYNPHLGYNKEADPLEIRIADAAYAAEHAIESHILDQFTNNGENMSSDGLYQALEKVIQDMDSIEEEAKEIQARVQHELHRNSAPPDSSRSSSIPQQSSMVGADDVKFQMMDKLTSDRLHLQIIPIVGMGGSGKTTLARTIYEERLIKEHFHICAWATISQEYSIREIFAVVLRQLNIGVADNLSEDELGEKLYKHLYGRRYLIIMDDMWSIEAWDRVRNYFPDNKNGSRIVVTTRLSDLASKLPNSNSLGMKLLDQADSWELLSKTVFGEKGCPLELEEIGKKIGKSCRGLPLSIVVVGGLLAKSKHTREFWEYIGENLNASVNLEDDERCLKILYMSYKHLPVHLKPCFLYMGVFAEDEKISISKLVNLWVTEGFLKAASGKSLEEIAKEYLEDIIGRSLLLIDELGSTGNIKTCKIHDLLRDLCLREAQKERFYTLGIRRHARQGRIVVYRNEAIYTSSPMVAAHSSMVWNLLQALPRLGVLLILDSGISRLDESEEFLGSIHHLVNLRFLSIAANCRIPFSIMLFWNLQTLIVDGFSEITAPADIWNMPQIRHVKFPGIRFPDPDPPRVRDDIVLGNLQTLQKIENFKCTEQVVKRISNIKKLKMYHIGPLGDSYFLTNLVCLDKLKSLTTRIDPYGPYSLQSIISFPHSLNKLTMEIGKSQCWEDVLDKIGALPLLQKLKLYKGSFKEGRWETIEGHFHSLKFLLLFYCKGLQAWTAESSHFPCLERLRLALLDELGEIPLDFAEIPTLREIDVEYCSDSAVESAKRISEEHEEYYGEGALQVRVVLTRTNKAGLESLASPNFRVKRF